MEQQRRIINVNDCYHFYLILYNRLYIPVEISYARIIDRIRLCYLYFIFAMGFLFFFFFIFLFLLIPPSEPRFTLGFCDIIHDVSKERHEFYWHNSNLSLYFSKLYGAVE